ncbi:hypothetical protein EV363DRAFT_1451265 [Boletus edulis]|nr:hypothetical protein EV363DRAFT_1451265 [Boletus edulis]
MSRRVLLPHTFAVQDATAQATLYTYLGIETAPPIEPPLLRIEARRSTVNMSFSWIQLGKGMLDRAFFIHLIKQDYHYLRAYALLAAKSHDFAPISSAAKVMQHIADEKTMHVSYCAKFSITLEELERTPESPATMAHGAFLIDVGFQGDTTKLLVALAAWLLGYGEVGLWLEKEAARSGKVIRIASG